MSTVDISRHKCIHFPIFFSSIISHKMANATNKIEIEQGVNNGENISLIDISCISLQHVDVAYKNYEKLGARLCEALSTCGFAYLKNHGIPERTVDECKAESENFFNLPNEIKTKYRYFIVSIFFNFELINFTK